MEVKINIYDTLFTLAFIEPFIRFSLLQQRKWVKEAEKSTKYPLKRLGGQKIPIKLPFTLKHDI